MSKYVVYCSVIAIALAGCVDESVGSATGAATIRDCEVTAVGTFPTGEAFSGVLSDIVGDEAIDWSHDAAGIAFNTVSLDGLDDIVCRQNGRVTATVLTSGGAVVNGDPDHAYYLFMEDNRDAPTGGGPVLLSAARTSPSTMWEDGEQTFSSRTAVTVPAEVTVTAGNPGRGFALLYFDDLRCKYRSDGTNYVFDKCPSDRAVAPGDELTVSSALLHIQNGQPCPGHDVDDPTTCGRIEGVVDLGTELVPAPGTPDFYQIVIFDAAGVEIYRFTGSLEDGDIAVTLL